MTQYAWIAALLTLALSALYLAHHGYRFAIHHLVAAQQDHLADQGILIDALQETVQLRRVMAVAAPPWEEADA